MLYFFDVPVYRIPRNKYYAERDRHIHQVMYSEAMERQFYAKNPDQAIHFEEHLRNAYGGCWEYNEIIGYIRMYLLGSQVRGEYFGIKAKRIVRTRRKIFQYRTYKLAPEIDVPTDASSSEIYQLIRKYLDNCRGELRERHVETEILDTIAPYVDWRQMFRNNLQGST